MTTSDTPPTRSTSSSTSTVVATTSEDVLALGKQLAEDLDPSDVLGRWMSHHIAELIIRAESAPSDEEPAARSAAAEAITRLWAARDGAPWRRRPLRDFEPVFAALERITETSSPWAFYRTFPHGAEPSGEETASHAVLAAACELESQIHRIVQSAIALAARDAETQEAAWVKVGLELADDDETRAINLLRRLRRRVEFARANRDQQDEAPIESSDLSDTATDPVLANLTAAIDRATNAIHELMNRLPPANNTESPRCNGDSSD